LGENIKVSVKPNVKLDLTAIIFSLAGVKNESAISPEKDMAFSNDLLKTLKKKGAKNHRTVVFIKSQIQERNAFRFLMGNGIQWEEYLNDFYDDYELSSYFGNKSYIEEYQKSSAEIYSFISSIMYNLEMENEGIDVLGTIDKKIKIELIPSYTFDSTGGTVDINEEIRAKMYFWTPFKGDEVFFPYGPEWLYQGFLHFLTYCYVENVRKEMVLESEKFIQRYAANKESITEDWLWRNIFLACRVLVFEKYTDENYANSLVKMYASQGSTLVGDLFGLLKRMPDNFTLQHKISECFEKIGKPKVNSEIGPFGSCLKDFRENNLVIQFTEMNGIEKHVKAIWRSKKQLIRPYRKAFIETNQLIYTTFEDKKEFEELTNNIVQVSKNKLICDDRIYTGENLRIRLLLNDQDSWKCVYGGKSIGTLRQYRRDIYLDIFFDFVIYDGNKLLTAGYIDHDKNEMIFAENATLQKLGLINLSKEDI
jgi:hypothetical protein